MIIGAWALTPTPAPCQAITVAAVNHSGVALFSFMENVSGQGACDRCLPGGVYCSMTLKKFITGPEAGWRTRIWTVLIFGA